MQLQFNHQRKTFVVAVSGGVDSVALLNLLKTDHPNNTYIVAHINHGIRQDAELDENLVKDLALRHNLQFESVQLSLGSNAGEALARSKRYDFLNLVKAKYQADAIITAHHQDDVIETMMINLIRGTGSRGLSSLGSTAELYRPMLNFNKQQIYQYASANNLVWREDSTNSSETYLRNKIRNRIFTKISPEQRRSALAIIDKATDINANLNKNLENIAKRGLHKGEPILNRRWFSLLDHDVSSEVIYYILKKIGANQLDKKSIEKIVVAIKTGRDGKVIQASGVDILLTKRSARFNLRGQSDKNQV